MKIFTKIKSCFNNKFGFLFLVGIVGILFALVFSSKINEFIYYILSFPMFLILLIMFNSWKEIILLILPLSLFVYYIYCSRIFENYVIENGILKSVIIYFFLSFIYYIILSFYIYVRGSKISYGEFLKVVYKQPNLAYYWFINSSSWEVLKYPLSENYIIDYPPNEWSVLFKLSVPDINCIVYVLGKKGEYEKTFSDFIKFQRESTIKDKFEA